MSAMATREETQAGAHSLPANIEAEAALLGGLLGNNDMIPAIAKLVSAEDFSEPVHQRLTAAIYERSHAGKAASPILLWPQFQDDEDLAELGGKTYLARLTGETQGLLVPLELAAEIHELAQRRALAQAGSRLTEAANDPTATLAELRSLAEESITPAALALPGAANFELLDIAQLEAMPAPRWLVRDLIGEEGLSVIYGDPGAGKSFLALDMALRIALGMEWHGVPTRQTGVLYIAGEGARGIGKRITGWRLAQNFDAGLDAPFLLLPTAVQITDPVQRATLMRTIDEAKDRAGFAIGLTVIDTVSRSIAGLVENAQEVMTAFVAACDEIRAHTGGATIGIHHSGKDKDRGMRGSSVLLGAVDTAIRAVKSEHLVTLKTEKQKDAEEGAPAYFELEKFEWQTGTAEHPGPVLSTLAPRRTDAVTTEASAGISGAMISSAFAIMGDAWTDGRPLSHRVQTRRDGRFAPRIFSSRIGGETGAWEMLIASWLENDCLAFEIYDKHSKQRGLKVIKPL